MIVGLTTALRLAERALAEVRQILDDGEPDEASQEDKP